MATHRKKSRGTNNTANDSELNEPLKYDDPDKEKLSDQELDGEDVDSSDSDEDSDEEEDVLDVEENVNVEFEARNPEEFDFHGIRQLISQLFLRTTIDISALTDIIITQKYVGSVIKQYIDDNDEEEMEVDDDDDDEDINQVFGVISCINLKDDKMKTCYAQLREHLTKKLDSDKAAISKLDSLFDDPSNSIGLLINERFVNIPAQIAVPSFDSLCQEMEIANKKGENFNFTHYLIVAKKFRMKLPNVGKKRHMKQALEQEIYSNGEEEYFAEAAEFKTTYSVAVERDSGVTRGWAAEAEDQYEPLREIIVVKSDRLPQILSNIKQALSQVTS